MKTKHSPDFKRDFYSFLYKTQLNSYVCASSSYTGTNNICLRETASCSLHKACYTACSVFTTCSNNGYIKQLFCISPLLKGKELSGDALEKSGCTPVPPTAVTKTPSLALSRVVCVRGAHNVFEMLNYSTLISLVFTQQLTIWLF